MGGHKVLTTAWVLLGVSLASAQIAAILALVVHPIDRLCCGIEKTLNDDWDMNCRQKFGPQSRYFKPFLGFLGAGAFFALLGLPVAMVGVARVRRWLSGDVLDTGHVRDLDRFRLRYLTRRDRPRVRASVAPLLTPGGAGVGLTLRW